MTPPGYQDDEPIIQAEFELDDAYTFDFDLPISPAAAATYCEEIAS